MSKNRNDKFKIAMIGHKRIPSREGGVEIVVEELSKRLVQLDYEVHVYNRMGNRISSKNNKTIKNNLKEYNGIKIKQVITINKKGLAALSSSLVATICALFKGYDVIHFHAEGPCAMIWIPHFFKIRTIATIHGLDWQRAKWSGFATKYIKFGEKVAVKYADEIIVLSQNMKDYFETIYNRNTIFIPNGIKKPELKELNVVKDKFDLKKDEYVLYLGRIVPEKGIGYLINAFKDVITNKKLVIAGGSSDTDSYFSEIIELAKNDKRIVFTGFVYGDILEELYSNAYIYCLPSDLEGMPISLLEAMSYGNCCVVSNIAECEQVVKDKGVIFDKSSIESLREKLQFLCDNKSIVERYKSEASSYICNKYNWDDVVDKTIDLYLKDVKVKRMEHTYENINY